MSLLGVAALSFSPPRHWRGIGGVPDQLESCPVLFSAVGHASRSGQGLTAVLSRVPKLLSHNRDSFTQCARTNQHAEPRYLYLFRRSECWASHPALAPPRSAKGLLYKRGTRKNHNRTTDWLLILIPATHDYISSHFQYLGRFFALVYS